MSLCITGCDIETTGLDQSKGAQIIEVGFSVYLTDDGVNFEHVNSYLQRCKPTVPIEIGAQHTHGITLADLAHEPGWTDIAPDVYGIVEKTDLMVCHNVEFDVPFLALELIRIGFKVPNFTTFCTMQNGRTATSLGKLPNLGELCWAFGVDYDADSAHAADYDIDKTMQCFFKGIEKGYFTVPAINRLLLKEAS